MLSPFNFPIVSLSQSSCANPPPLPKKIWMTKTLASIRQYKTISRRIRNKDCIQYLKNPRRKNKKIRVKKVRIRALAGLQSISVMVIANGYNSQKMCLRRNLWWIYPMCCLIINLLIYSALAPKCCHQIALSTFAEKLTSLKSATRWTTTTYLKVTARTKRVKPSNRCP